MGYRLLGLFQMDDAIAIALAHPFVLTAAGLLHVGNAAGVEGKQPRKSK